MPGYCAPDDVRKALQEVDLSGELGTEYVTAAIEGQSKWLRTRTKRHYYDSGHSAGDLYTSTRTVSDLTLDVPSGPHAKDRQLTRPDYGIEYPTTHVGQYAKLRLPRRDVQSIDKLEVRERGGDVEDWVASSDRVQGRGDDYYLLTESESGVSHLYVDAESLGVRTDYRDLLTLEVSYGVDGIPGTIKRATAFRAGAELVLDDDTQVGVTDAGQLVNVETKAQAMRDRAMDLLGPYIVRPIA